MYKIVAELVFFSVMGFVLVNIDQIQRVIRHLRSRTFRLILFVKLVDKHHHLSGFVPEVLNMIFKVLLIVHFLEMGVFHIKKRKIRNCFVRIRGRLIAHIYTHLYPVKDLIGHVSIPA